MTRDSQTRNQFETQLSGVFAAGSYLMAVDSTAGFEIDEPIYLVVDPDVPAKREWVRVVSITGNTFNIDSGSNDHGTDGRGLAGSTAGDIEHDAGAKVRSVTTEQIFLDIFADLEDILGTGPLSLTAHIANQNQDTPLDPHNNAGYLHSGSHGPTADRDADTFYVRLDNDTTLNPTISIKTAETVFVDQDLVNKLFVDAETDKLLLLDGTRPMVGELDMGSDKILNLVAGTDPTDAAATSQVTAVATNLSDHEGDVDDPHVAAAYILADGTRSMAAPLQMGAQKITNLAAGSVNGDGIEWAQFKALLDRVDALESAPPAHTHAGSDVTSAIGVSEVPNLPASKTTSGAFADARIPALATSKITSGVFGLAQIPDIPAADIIPGSFRAGTYQVGAGTWTFLGSVGIAGPFNANSNVDFSGLSVDAGATVLRIAGNGVRRSS